MNEKQQIELAAKLLRISIDEATEYHSIIEDGGLVYVSVPEKGGESIIVDKNGEVLYADSSVGYSQHMEEYKNGTRTPLEAFER